MAVIYSCHTPYNKDAFPFSVPLWAGVVALVGYGHTCALLTGGGVDCWGWNGYAQLGTGDTSGRYTPTGVTGLGAGGRGGAFVLV